jgi:hypothetical protein
VSVVDKSIMGIFLTDLSVPFVAAPFEIVWNFNPDENSVIIVAIPDTKTGINQTLTVRLHSTYADRYVVIVIINYKY